jgi:hypothetical protein
MACSPSQHFIYDDETNLTLADISSSEERVASYSDLIMSSPTLSLDIPADGSWNDETIDPALLTRYGASRDISAYAKLMQQP